MAKRSRYDESGEWRERRLEDEFEPIILSEKYMTEKDDRIREIDIPERMQVFVQLEEFCFDVTIGCVYTNLYILPSVGIRGKHWSSPHG